MIAVRNAALARREDGAVGVAVERHAQVRALRFGLLRHGRGIERAASEVDIAAVRLSIEDARFDSEPLDQLGNHAAGGAVRAVENQTRSRNVVPVRDQADEMVDVIAHQGGVGLDRGLGFKRPSLLVRPASLV